MAELNPNIILAAKTPDMPNPLDSAVKALSMSNLMQEHQSNTLKLSQEQRQNADQQSMRDAFKNNTQSDPNGNPIVDRQGVMKDLMAANPLLAQKQSMDFKQMDLDQMTKQHAIEKQVFFSIPTDANTSPEDKQAAYAAGRQKLISLGIPGVQNSPEQYPGDQKMRSFQNQALTAEEQLAQQNKQQEFAMKKMDYDLAQKKLDVEQSHYTNDKNSAAVQNFNTGVSGSRQQPDAAKELLNVQSAKNINEIVNQAPDGDLNKLNNQQTKLAMMEVVKMAGGSVPTESELKTMTPDTVVQKYGGLMQNITGKSQPANAGEFLKQGIDYANGIADVSKKSLTQRSNEMFERLSPQMNPQSRDIIRKQIDNEFKSKDDGSKKQVSGNFSSDIVSYASKHGITPEQAAAIKAQRTKTAAE